MTWFDEINQQLRDELRGITQLGMQQAAEMLSRLLRQPVAVTVPEAVDASAFDQSDSLTTDGLGVIMEISGDLNGAMQLFFPEWSAAWLSCQLLGQGEVGNLLQEPASSTLKEVGNIIASAFLASIDQQLGLRALPSPPKLLRAKMSDLLPSQSQLEPCPIVCTRLSNDGGGDSPLCGEIYLFPQPESLELLLARVAQR